MKHTRRIYLCDSHKPKVHGGGCCSDKGSQTLLKTFSRLITKHRIHDQVELIPTTCLSQCLTGVSVRIWPDQVYYGKVTNEDAEEIIVEHLIGGQPVKRVQIEPHLRFASW